MAGAGQPWYMPLLWPVGHVGNAISRPKEEEAPKPAASPDLDLIGHLTSFAGASRSLLIAYALIYFAYDGNNYPAFGAARAWGASWMWPIVVRNLVATWAICGFWDWFLYFSPLQAKLHKFKFNPTYPSNKQLMRDAFWTTTASIVAAAMEIVLCHYWATGALAMRREMTLYDLAWGVTITHWRVPHFYLIHRAMHPWKTKSVPDVGQFLYKHVHSLHHKSYNPTAFSGTNMHPVESAAYYSASLIAVAFGCHPAVVLGCIVDCAVGAWLGHDGFQWPGSGDFFHQLHHAHFDCNYGAMHVPLDKWFGTYASCKGDVKEMWRTTSDDRKQS